MSDDKTVSIEIRAKNLTTEAFQKVQAALRTVGDESARTTAQASTDWAKWFKTIGGGVATGNLLSDAFKLVGRELINIPNQLLELGARGADVRDVKGAFDGLTQSVGQTSQAMLGSLRQAFGGTVADFDLMKSANEGLSKGVKFTADDMGILGKAARVMADRVGGDAKQSFDKLIEGIADGREKTLRGLPLNFQNIETAVKSYADAIGTEVSKLTDAQKQEALRQAVLKESQRLLAESGEIENDFADKVAAGAASIRNQTDKIAEWVSKHGGMIAGMGGMAQAAAQLSPLLGAGGLAGAASALAGVLLSPAGLVAGLAAAAFAFTQFKVSEIERQGEAMAAVADKLKLRARDAAEASQLLAAYQAGLRNEALALKDAMGNLVPPTLRMWDAWKEGAKEAGHLKGEITALSVGGFGPGVTTTKSYAQVLREMLAELHRLPQATLDEVAAMQAFGKNEDEIRIKTGLNTFQQKLLVQVSKDGAKATKDYEKTWKNLLTPLHDATEGLGDLKHILPGVVDVETIQRHTELERLMREQVPAAENWHERLMRVRGLVEAMVPALGSMNDKLAEQQRRIHAVIEQARAALNADLQKGLNLGASLTQTIVGALQGGGNVGKSAGGFLGGELGKWAGEGLAKSLTATLGSKLAGSIGGALGPLGAIGGQLLGGLVDKLFSRNQGRDAVKQWVDDTFGSFDNLQQKLNELPNGQGLWVQLTQLKKNGSLEEAKRAIDAVTAAFDKQKTAVQATGEAAKAAAQKEIDAQQEVIDEIKGRREELARQIADLTKRIDAEAWEEEIGIQEQRDRAERDRLIERQKAIDDELAKAEAKQAENVERLEKAISDLAAALTKLTEKTWKVPVVLDVDDSGLPSGSNAEMPEHDTGAFIRRDHVARVHRGELIGPIDFMTRALTGALQSLQWAPPTGPGLAMAGAGGGEIHLHVTVDPLTGTVIDQRIDARGQVNLQSGRWKPRATAGRTS